MNYFGPRVATPYEGFNWLRQALYLLLRHPVPFLVSALLAPAGSALLLALPVWEVLPFSSGWPAAVITAVCYGLPLTAAISVATGVARSVSRGNPPLLAQLWTASVLQVLAKPVLFMFALLSQGYLAIHLLRPLLSPATLMASLGKPHSSPSFVMVDTILGMQLAMTGGLLLILQLLFACFVTPLYLFQGTSLYNGWQLSFLAMQINPWLGLGLGLFGLLLIALSYCNALSAAAQLLALPLPAYLGALLYVAWLELFQGGVEEQPAVPDKAAV